MTKQENFLKFLENAAIKHNNFYNYDKFTYDTARIASTITCPIHGDFQQRPDNHLQGKGCKLCGINKLKNLFTKTKEKFIEESNLIHNDKYDYSKSEYINDSTKLIITCPIHGDFEQKPNDHLQGSGCLNCKSNRFSDSMNKKYSTIFIDRAKKVHGDKYDYLEYTAMRKNMTIICKKHGEFKQRPDNHLKGNGCPSCDNSLGELLIENYLNNLNIKFKKEKKFDGCKNKEKLPFDFYIEEKNIIIEFDGIQHFEPIEFFGGQNGLKYRQKNDKIKNEYCKNNNIRLIRIPYFKIKEIDVILNKELTV
jgi:very-short-patch-repair endonuclease